ncbi:MAG: hypothetical protein ABS87_07325 [Sphingomonas sp. SCN 67-18]|nr:MAG: hypothetical protein ABS87_07325 [Sphingomonas sp. SCN 67-18]
MAAAPLAAEPAAPPGFTSLFDGKTLNGWRGDPALWSVRDGVIDGGSDEPVKHATYLIHEGNFADFELHFKYRFIADGNSGFQIRSRVIDEAKFDVAGYQANVVPPGQNVRFAMLYDMVGRSEIALLSEKVEISEENGKVKRVISGSVNPIQTILSSYKPYPEWNDYVVIAYGNRIIHVVNGYLAVDAVDLNPAGARDGVLALQLDFGSAMRVQFKDIAVKRLTAAPDISGRFQTIAGPPQTTPEIPRRPPHK